MLGETEEAARRQRFGLFSQPPPLYLGDDSGFRATTHKRDEQGKPVLQPRNMKVTASRGKDALDLFSFDATSKYPEKYVEPAKVDRILDLRLFKAKARHDAKFKPASSYKPLATGPY